ncbi:MAG TPA: CHAD domain-containing protein [Terriglobales bacterium]|nr:CHAD domain-containing protein [Terriglobales bacterium]
MSTAPASAHEKRGIQHWMERVVEECQRVQAGFEADPVHDLRVALRRCRSMAEGFRAIDPDPTWRRMRKAGKTVFSALGELRDVQVLKDWVERLGGANDPAKDRLSAYCLDRERQLKKQAEDALAGFDTHAWLHWARVLNSRERQLPAGSEVFQVIALEKLEDALRLHRTALRNRSKVALHALRIGIKRFRYVVENFLPEQDERWSKDLKQLQDVLGEIHDLDVLWATALRIRAFAKPEEREHWRGAIARERAERVALYRQKLVGPKSLLGVWREGLLSGEALQRAIAKKFEIWAGFMDPDPAHAKRVRQRSLEIYDGLVASGVTRQAALHQVEARELLSVAAIAHGVGRAAGRKKCHKRTARLLEQLDVPPGWTADDLRTVGLVARFHRGALPVMQPAFARLARAKKHLVALLSGILRLAEAVDRGGRKGVKKIELERHNGFLVLRAEGYPATGKRPEWIAAGRYLLESACGLPILVSNSGSRPL